MLVKTAPAISPREAHAGSWLRFVSNHVSHAFKREVEAHAIRAAEWMVFRQLVALGQAQPSRLCGRAADDAHPAPVIRRPERTDVAVTQSRGCFSYRVESAVA
jgi:hypothetical protein